MDRLDDARIDIRHPRPRRAEVLREEELDDAFDGAELVRCFQGPEVLRLHVAHVFEARGHGAAFDLGEGAAQACPACWGRGGAGRVDGDQGGRRGVAWGEGLREGEGEGQGAEAEEGEEGGGLHDCFCRSTGFALW